MRWFVAVLAASLLGADRPRGAETPTIAYQIKIVEMNGLGWRSALHSQLQPVARQGAATVWTASREAASRLADKALSDKAGRIVTAPRVTADPEVRATIFANSTRKIVTEVSREADGPVNHASFVGYVPRVEDASEGWSAEVTGRALDQGVLARLTLDDRQITALHSVPLSEVLESKGGKGYGDKAPVEVAIQIPEHARTTVSGEWLIPRDGVLIVSLGVHTVAGADGKAVARERLAVIEAEAVAGQPGTLTAGPLNLSALRKVMLGGPAQPPLSASNMPPAVPSRSLPLALNASGQPVPLPPLPAARAPATVFPGSLEPCASAQAGTPAVEGEPAPAKRVEPRDGSTGRASFSVEPPMVNEKGDRVAPPKSNWSPSPVLATPSSRPAASGNTPTACCAADGECCEAPTTPAVGKVIRLRLPLGAGLKIEIDAKVTPVGPATIGVDY